MKKLLFVFTLIILSFCFIACPLLPHDSLDSHDLMSPEEMVELMNKQNFGTTFTLKDSSVYENDSRKYLVVYLEAADLPGKQVRAFQFFGWDYGDDILESEIVYPQESRTSFINIMEYRVTDYYFIKYQDELYSQFQSLYQPVLQNLTENTDYIFAFKPDLRSFPIEDTNYSYHSEKTHNFENVQDVLKNAGFKTYLLVNKEWNSEFERKFNAFAYDLKNSDDDYELKASFYFSTKYPCSKVFVKDLVNDSFYSQNDLDDSSLIKYVLYIY